MISRRLAADEAQPMLRIGEVAKLTGLTSRTLRYWEELGILIPSGYRDSGERLYTATDMARVIRIRDLQELLGFSLSEVRVVLETEDIDILDRVRSEYPVVDEARRRQLVDDAIEANERLLTRLDDTLARIAAFRDERAAKAQQLKEARARFDHEGPAGDAGGSTNGDAGPADEAR